MNYDPYFSRATQEAWAAQLRHMADQLLSQPADSGSSAKQRDSCGDKIFDFEDQVWLNSFGVPTPRRSVEEAD